MSTPTNKSMEERAREAVALAIRANGGTDWHKGACQCEPEVGAVPCEYCAIFDGLRQAGSILAALQEHESAEVTRLKSVNQALVDNSKISARIHIEEINSWKTDLANADEVIAQLRADLERAQAESDVWEGSADRHREEHAALKSALARVEQEKEELRNKLAV